MDTQRAERNPEPEGGAFREIVRQLPKPDLGLDKENPFIAALEREADAEAETAEGIKKRLAMAQEYAAQKVDEAGDVLLVRLMTKAGLISARTRIPASAMAGMTESKKKKVIARTKQQMLAKLKRIPLSQIRERIEREKAEKRQEEAVNALPAQELSTSEGPSQPVE